MAKLNHVLFGQAKGKVGGMVLQRYEGMNIAREKPITVKNPQSDKQVTQRAKFKLASQIVANFKETISVRLTELSIYERARRAGAIKAIIAAINTSTPLTPATSFTNTANAINALRTSGLGTPTISQGEDAFSVVIPDGAFGVITMCSYDGSGNLMAKSVETYTSDGTAKQVSYSDTSAIDVVMVCYTEANTEEGRATISNLNVPSTGSNFQNTISRAIAAGDLEVSDMAVAYLAD